MRVLPITHLIVQLSSTIHYSPLQSQDCNSPQKSPCVWGIQQSVAAISGSSNRLSTIAQTSHQGVARWHSFGLGRRLVSSRHQVLKHGLALKSQGQ